MANGINLTATFSAAIPPSNLKVTDIGKRRVTIEWEKPSMVGSIQGYKVRYDKVTCYHSNLTFAFLFHLQAFFKRAINFINCLITQREICTGNIKLRPYCSDRAIARSIQHS